MRLPFLLGYCFECFQFIAQLSAVLNVIQDVELIFFLQLSESSYEIAIHLVDFITK